LQRISDASEQLLRVLSKDDPKTTPYMQQLEFQRVLGGPAELESFLDNVNRVRGHAEWALDRYRPTAVKSGLPRNSFDLYFRKNIIEIAQYLGADIRLPSNGNADDDERPIMAFTQYALWLAIDRARAMPAVIAKLTGIRKTEMEKILPDVIRDLEELHNRKPRQLERDEFRFGHSRH
jgi:hypothetical protein